MMTAKIARTLASEAAQMLPLGTYMVLASQNDDGWHVAFTSVTDVSEAPMVVHTETGYTMWLAYLLHRAIEQVRSAA